MTDTSITRIAVLGDSGVGKTSLLSVLCHKAVLKSPSWTVGCAIEVLLHGDSCIELRDVGGGKAQHRRSRAIFYKDVHALILVHDLTNRKSCDNLRKWVAEFLASKEPTGVTTVSSSSRLKSRTSSSESVPDSMMSTLNPTPGTISTSTSELPLSSVPMLIIGTKCDLVSPADLRERRVPIADSANADSIFVSCMDPLAFSAGTGKRIERFLERAVESQVRQRR